MKSMSSNIVGGAQKAPHASITSICGGFLKTLFAPMPKCGNCRFYIEGRKGDGRCTLKGFLEWQSSFCKDYERQEVKK